MSRTPEELSHALSVPRTDRRGFLQLMGLGGAGLVGLGVLGRAGTAHAETMDAITLGDRINTLATAPSAHGSGFTWGGWCQAAQYWAERAVGRTDAQTPTYKNATTAWQASHIVSTSMGGEPAGSFSYFNASADGHVVTNIGNGYCINTSDNSSNKHYYNFGHGLYISRLADYELGAYRGWSYGNGVNPQIPVQPWSPGDGGGGSSWAWNAPDTATQKRVQTALKARGRYSGPEDGDWGVNSIKGIQTTCANVGYTGPIDGVPGKNTCHYVQVYAQKFGSYTGPVDDVLGPNSWSGFALGLERP